VSAREKTKYHPGPPPVHLRGAGAKNLGVHKIFSLPAAVYTSINLPRFSNFFLSREKSSEKKQINGHRNKRVSFDARG
jgi:hypothetical protein